MGSSAGNVEAAKRPMNRRRLTRAGERLKGLLDPLILPTVDQFPQLTCGFIIAFHVFLILLAGQIFDFLWRSGTSGTLLQGPYDLVRGFPGSSSPLFVIAPYAATHVITCVVYLLLDWWRPSFVQKMMAQTRPAGDWGGPELGLKKTLLTQLTVVPFTTALALLMINRGGPVAYTKPWVETCLDLCDLQLPAEAPSVLEMLVHLAFCLVVVDAAYGYVHWQMHRHRSLWKHIHSIHHEYKETFVTVGPHVQFMEFLSVFTFGLIAPCACGAHPFTSWVWGALFTLCSLEAHTGWHQTPMGWLMNVFTLGHYGGSMHHHLHHAVVWGNYAPFLTYLDKLVGTEVHENVEVAPDAPGVDAKEASTEALGATAPEMLKVPALPEGGTDPVKADLAFEKVKLSRSRAATPPPKKSQ